MRKNPRYNNPKDVPLFMKEKRAAARDAFVAAATAHQSTLLPKKYMHGHARFHNLTRTAS